MSLSQPQSTRRVLLYSRSVSDFTFFTSWHFLSTWLRRVDTSVRETTAGQVTEPILIVATEKWVIEQVCWEKMCPVERAPQVCGEPVFLSSRGWGTWKKWQTFCILAPPFWPPFWSPQTQDCGHLGPDMQRMGSAFSPGSCFPNWALLRRHNAIFHYASFQNATLQQVISSPVHAGLYFP